MTMQNTAGVLQIIELTDMVEHSGYQENINFSTYGDTMDTPDPMSTVDLSEYMEAAERSEYQKKMGWVSPDYSTSRSVQLDIQTAVDNRCIAIDNGIADAEIYRILRAQILRHCEDAECGKTLMVTSAVQQEGTTVTAINLAMTLAKEFSQTVLLVDCDFRQQHIHQTLSYESDKGLVDYLLHNTPLSEIVVWPGIEKLTIISGGKPIGAFSEILGSPGMRKLIEEMKNRYPERYVIFDAPPVLSCSDTLALAPLVDNIIMVVRADKTSRKDVVTALDMLPRDKVVGFVLNKVPVRL